MRYNVKAQVPHHADPEVVFDLLSTTSRWLDWSFASEAERVRDGSPDLEGVGAERRFKTGRTRVHERVVAFERPRHFAYVLLDGMPLKGYRADVHIDERTIRWESSFAPKYPGTGPLYKFAMTVFLKRTTKALAKKAEAAARQP